MQKPISKMQAIDVAKAHLQLNSACVEMVEKYVAEYFNTGRELREAYPFRGELGTSDPITLGNSYWSVLLVFRPNAGRKLLMSVTIDASSGKPVDLPPEFAPTNCGRP